MWRLLPYKTLRKPSLPLYSKFWGVFCLFFSFENGSVDFFLVSSVNPVDSVDIKGSTTLNDSVSELSSCQMMAHLEGNGVLCKILRAISKKRLFIQWDHFPVFLKVFFLYFY